MIIVHVIQTTKNYNPESKWEVSNSFWKPFSTVELAMEWIDLTYNGKKREKMFIDDNLHDCKVHCGYSIGFRNQDISHVPVRNWLQRDQITILDASVVNLSN